MSERLKNIIATILEVPVERVTDDASTETLDNWDSVKQMDIMLGTEDEFKVQFKEEEIATLTSYRAIRDALTARGMAVA